MAQDNSINSSVNSTGESTVSPISISNEVTHGDVDVGDSMCKVNNGIASKNNDVHTISLVVSTKVSVRRRSVQKKRHRLLFTDEGEEVIRSSRKV